MSKSTLSKTVQEQIAREGAIIGTVAAVRATLQQILQDSRFRHITAVYGPTSRPTPGKEPGTPYTVLACGGGPVNGTRSAQESADRLVDNDTIAIYCADADRRSWRTPKVPLITSVEVYTGRKVPTGHTVVDEDGNERPVYKAERKAVPVVCVKVG